jgi:hypothetical protein
MYFAAWRHPNRMPNIISYPLMKYGLVFISAIAVTTASAQAKRLDPQADTAFWYSLKVQDAARIGLADLMTTTDSLHIRYWMENQAVEVRTNDFVHFDGIISNHTEKVETNKKTGLPSPNPKFYSNKTRLSGAEARNVFDLFEQSRVFQMPSDQEIKNWQQGDDGAEYLLECATSSTYSFKAYWTPSAQQGVPEADTLLALNKRLRQIINLDASWKSFLATLPPGCYRVGEMTIVCPIIKTQPKKSHE